MDEKLELVEDAKDDAVSAVDDELNRPDGDTDRLKLDPIGRTGPLDLLDDFDISVSREKCL